MGGRFDRLLLALRGRILSGEYAEGARLPNRLALVTEFGMSSTTVQRAIDQLAAEGFVESRFKRGTFVSDYPPHRYRIALVSSYLQRDSLYLQSLVRVAEEISSGSPHTIVPYFPLHPTNPSPDYYRLCDDVATHRVAGIIFINVPRASWEHLPILDTPDMPRVAIVNGQTPSPAALPLSLNAPDFTRMACEQLVCEGRRRVAFISAAGSSKYSLEHFSSFTNAFQLQTFSYWCHQVHHQYSEMARSLTHLLFHEGQHQRPDALIISDDNLVEQSLLGLADAGVRVPEDVSVIAWGNAPLLPATVQPVTWIGFDHRITMRSALEMLEELRRGEEAVPRSIDALLFSTVAPLPLECDCSPASKG